MQTVQADFRSCPFSITYNMFYSNVRTYSSDGIVESSFTLFLSTPLLKRKIPFGFRIFKNLFKDIMIAFYGI